MADRQINVCVRTLVTLQKLPFPFVLSPLTPVDCSQSCSGDNPTSFSCAPAPAFSAPPPLRLPASSCFVRSEPWLIRARSRSAITMHSVLRSCLRRASRFHATSSNANRGVSGQVPRGYKSVQVIGCRIRTHSFWDKHDQGWSFAIAIAAASGSLGGVSIAVADAGSDSLPTTREPDQSSKLSPKKKRVVVLGTGWAAMSFFKNLDTTLYDVQVISPRNFFVFTPLLPSVTSGTVEARSITESIRKIMKHKKDVKFCQAHCVQVNSANRKVLCRPVADSDVLGKRDFEVEYDYLVIAVGAKANTFNTPGVEKYCHFLKEIEDAEKIRESIVDCFELAALPNISEEERKRLLHFVTVGGGPTGVEFAAELHDLIHEDLLNLYPDFTSCVEITVIQSGDHILNTFDQRISNFAEQKFQRDGVKVKTGCRVMEIQEKAVVVKEKDSGKKIEVPFGMIVWSTGIGTQSVVADFMQQIGQTDRRALATDEWLRVKGCEDVFALGDCATIEQRRLLEDVAYIFELADKDNSGTLSANEFKETMELISSRYPQIDIYLKRRHMRDVLAILDETGASGSGEIDIEKFKKALSQVDSQMTTLPATAQVAAQQGEYLARCFNDRAKCDLEPEGPLRMRAKGRHRFRPFSYKHFGQFAPLGGEQAAAELPGDWVSIGRSTQWLWYSVYASKQVSWRTRALVIFDWTKHFIFGRDTSRM